MTVIVYDDVVRLHARFISTTDLEMNHPFRRPDSVEILPRKEAIKAISARPIPKICYASRNAQSSQMAPPLEQVRVTIFIYQFSRAGQIFQAA